MSDSEFGHDHPRRYGQPYTGHHPVPTIKSYEEELHSRSDANAATEAKWNNWEDLNSTQGSVHDEAHGGRISDNRPHGDVDYSHTQKTSSGYPRSASIYSHDSAISQNTSIPKFREDAHNERHHSVKDKSEKQDALQDPISVVEASRNQPSPFREPSKGSRGESSNEKPVGRKAQHRVVTDPITHLPVTIHDNNSDELEHIPFSAPNGVSDSGDALKTGSNQNQKKHNYLQSLVDREIESEEASGSNQRRKLYLPLEIGSVVSGLVILGGISSISGRGYSWAILCLGLSSIGLLGASIGFGVGWWINRSFSTGTVVTQFNPDENDRSDVSRADDSGPSFNAETTLWLNNTISSLWPLINPDLFVSLCDILEDVMQASLQNATKLPVEGVSVSDWGQGSDPPSILGIRWLDQGLAGEEKNGMEAEEGEFVNLELALSYKATKSGKGLKKKLKNIHVFVEFWWKGGFRLPIWTEIRSFISTARVRLQLSPDPPFFSVCTLTLLGQPKITISCVPLTKRFPNIMDIPIISSFVQKSIDAAVAQYVAPKSLTLDLKQMILGDDVRKDTVAKGVLIIKISGARGFKDGDGTKSWISGASITKKVRKTFGENEEHEGQESSGGGDTYVAVGWSKFGKPVFKTRIITNCHTPAWEELTAVLVGPDEVNAGERLCLKLWDSDRLTADDLLGTVEVDLQELMHSPESAGKIQSRVDRLLDLTTHKPMPGELSWSVGYFGKTTPSEEQLGVKARNMEDNPVEDRERKDEILKRARQFRQGLEQETEAKLREAPRDSPLLHREVEQQKAQDLKDATDTLIASSAPDPDYLSGILSVQIHQGIGLELQKTRNPDRKIFRGTEETLERASDEEDKEEGEDLPSPYCNIVLNHVNVYKTRVKWKTSTPFFNAGMERFIRNWKTTEIIIAVKDARMHENDALVGVVVLPLKDILKESSKLNGVFPLCGGIGYGRLRVSILFRGVTSKLPPNLLGWGVGTLQIRPQVRCIGNVPPEISSSRLVFRTAYGKGHMYPDTDNGNTGNMAFWETRHDRNLHLAVKRRYSSFMLIEFQKSHSIDILTSHSVMAFSILWLKDIPDSDDEGSSLRLPIWGLLNESKGDTKDILSQATKNVQERYGEELGSVELQLGFIPGLGGYHGKIAKRDRNMREVMEVLDSAGEAKEVNQDIEGGEYGSDISSSSDSSESEGGSESHDANPQSSENQLRNDGNRGPIKDLKEYKMNKYQLHRHHKGVMQWKGVRTLKWVKDEIKQKGQHMIENVEKKIKHDGGDGDWYGDDEGEGGVETEV